MIRITFSEQASFIISICIHHLFNTLDTGDCSELSVLIRVVFIFYFSFRSIFHWSDENFKHFLYYYMIPGNSYCHNQFSFIWQAPHLYKSFQALCNFSIELRSGLFPGHNNNSILFVLNQLMILLLCDKEQKPAEKKVKHC